MNCNFRYQKSILKKAKIIFFLILIHLILFSLFSFTDSSIKENALNHSNATELNPSSSNLKLLKYKNFTNLWIMDESENPTGTHKDRFAEAVLQIYINKIMFGKDKNIPQASIISAGSAAIAIQALLRKHNLPNLKVLTDYRISKSVIHQMTTLGCEVYQVDLEQRWLGPQDILHLTNNSQGFDLTFEGSSEILSQCYADLAKYIINQEPDYIFVPYGSGLLYHNFLIVEKNSQRMKQPCLLGATVLNPISRATKLYSPYKSWPISIKSVEDQDSLLPGVYDIRESSITYAEEIFRETGYKAEPSGASGLALLLELEDFLPKDKKIIVVSTGMAKLPE